MSSEFPNDCNKESISSAQLNSYNLLLDGELYIHNKPL